MISRPKFYRHKPIMLMNDVPVKVEIENKDKFSAASNLNILTTLRTGRINPHNTAPVEGFKGIISTKIHTTYFDYSYFGEPDTGKNFDFKNEFRKRRDLQIISPRDGEGDYFVDEDVEVLTQKSIPKHTFYKLEHQKDVYISFRLKEQLELLIKEINEVKPELIIVTGKWGLFFLTGLVSLSQTLGNTKDRKPLGGLSTYRTSIERVHPCFEIEHKCIVVPVYHTLQSLTMPEKIPFIELDYQKLGYIYKNICDKGIEIYDKKRETAYVGTDKQSILSYVDNILEEVKRKPTIVSFDIETMYSAIIDCIGITTKTDEGLCIPFAKAEEPNIWDLEDEVEIMTKLREVMLHPNCQHIGQNYSYENQFYHKLWGSDTPAKYDSMIISHVLYNYMQKDLAFLASIYSDYYIYWKDEITPSKEHPEQRWEYNVKDITYTLEITNILLSILSGSDEKLQEFYHFQQDKVAPILDRVMNRGVKINVEKKEKFYVFFHTLLLEVEQKIKDAIGEPDFNVNSVPQKVKLFKNLLGMKLTKAKKSGNDTTDSASMKEYIVNYPLYASFLTLILEYQSLKVFVNTFLGMELDEDNRARTQYKIAATDTYRLSSTKNVWGKGANFQNLPSKGKIELIQTKIIAKESNTPIIINNLTGEVLELPNVKEMFIPDGEDWVFFNGDFSSEDARIVGHVANCKFYIDIFKEGLDIYTILASEYYHKKITKNNPIRQTFKMVTHASAYGGYSKTISRGTGLLIHEVERLQKWFFSVCPEIKAWHKQVVHDISTKGYITNIFGARGWFLNTNDKTLKNKAIAWRPQSEVGILTNKGLVNIEENEQGKIEVLLQTHDSVSGQYLKVDKTAKERIVKHMTMTLPYDVPLTIPVDIETSEISYGDCK